MEPCIVCQKPAKMQCCEVGKYCGETCRAMDWDSHKIYHGVYDQVLQNPIILRNILKNMTVTELLQLAIVNKSWKDAARSNEIWRDRYLNLKKEENFLFMFFEMFNENINPVAKVAIQQYPTSANNYFKEFYTIWSALPHVWINSNNKIEQLGWWNPEYFESVDFAWIHLGRLWPYFRRTTKQNHFKFEIGKIIFDSSNGSSFINFMNDSEIDMRFSINGNTEDLLIKIVGNFLAHQVTIDVIGKAYLMFMEINSNFYNQYDFYLFLREQTRFVSEFALFASFMFFFNNVLRFDPNSLISGTKGNLIITQESDPTKIQVYRNGKAVLMPNIWIHNKADKTDLMASKVSTKIY